MLQRLVLESRAPSEEERRLLARWPGWGATPELFDEDDARYADERAQLKALRTDGEWAAARRTVLNTHYTYRDFAHSIWEALAESGFTTGEVLEPGSGSGNFIGTAPAGVQMVGVKVDPATARISQLVYPQAQIRIESFADTQLTGDGFYAVVGYVPFPNATQHDPACNAEKKSMYNHFIVKSLSTTKPSGFAARPTYIHRKCLTSVLSPRAPTVGAVADLAATDRDPFAGPVASIHATKNVATWVAGRRVFA